MKAFVVESGRRVSPWLDPAHACPILNRPLSAWTAQALDEAGLERVESPPTDEAYVLISDRTWLTGRTLRLFLASAAPGSRLRVEDPDWLALTLPLQRLDAAGVYEVGLVAAGGPPDFGTLAPLTVDLGFEVRETSAPHAALAHAMPERFPHGDAPVHQIDHWSHLLRVNLLAMGAELSAYKRRWEDANVLVKLWWALIVVSRIRSWNRWGVARAMNQVGRGCVIHPTAVVEGCRIGDGVEIGPGAIVRGSQIGDDVVIEEQAIVNLSVLGEGTRVGRRATSNLVVTFPRAFFGAANGYQATVFGRDSFAAWTVTVFDLSFGRAIKVFLDGERVSSGGWFLGAALGHRVRIGGKVDLGYGAEVPNDAFLVGDRDGVLTDWEDGEGPHRVFGNTARPVKSPRAAAPTDDDPAS